MKIAICDDREDDRGALRTLLEAYGQDFEIKEYNSGKGLCGDMDYIRECGIVFLDINMDGMDGLEVARQIKAVCPKVHIVLVTAYVNYALDGYKVRASRFLLKDDLEQTLQECMDDILREILLEERVNMDYSYLFEQMFGVSNIAKNVASGGNMVKMSDLSSPSVQSQLKAAGIDTNSKQYQTVVKSMMTASRGGGYFTVQGIKNRMQYYDEDGDHINQAFGVSGLTVTDKNIASKNRIISIPDSIKDDMFELTKKEFLQENGVANGDTTRRSDVYRKMYPQITKNDRLAAGHTLSQYERAYTQAFVDAVKAVDPKWKPGKPIPSGALDGITRESIDNSLVKSGGSLVRKTSSGSSLDIQV